MWCSQSDWLVWLSLLEALAGGCVALLAPARPEPVTQTRPRGAVSPHVRWTSIPHSQATLHSHHRHRRSSNPPDCWTPCLSEKKHQNKSQLFFCKSNQKKKLNKFWGNEENSIQKLVNISDCPFPPSQVLAIQKDKGSQSVTDSLVKWEAWWTLRQEERVFILEGEKNWGWGWAKLNVPHFRWDNPALFFAVVSTANKSGMYRRRDIRLWSNILLSIGLTCSPGYNCKFKERETVDSLEDCTRFEIKPQTQSGLGLCNDFTGRQERVRSELN